LRLCLNGGTAGRPLFIRNRAAGPARQEVAGETRLAGPGGKTRWWETYPQCLEGIKRQPPSARENEQEVNR